MACTQNKPDYMALAELALLQALGEPVPIPGPSLFEALRLGPFLDRRALEPFLGTCNQSS